jgi:hypothetical protein
MFGENARLQLDFSGNDFCQGRMAIVKESGEAIEIGERSSRPLKLHWPFQGRKADVPQVSSQRTTSSWATVGSPALMAAHPIKVAQFPP